MAETPKPRECPFCGGEAAMLVIEPHDHLFVDMPHYDGGAFIECSGCAAAMSGDTADKAAAAWNRRAADAELQRYREAEPMNIEKVLPTQMDYDFDGGVVLCGECSTMLVCDENTGALPLKCPNCKCIIDWDGWHAEAALDAQKGGDGV